MNSILVYTRLHQTDEKWIFERTRKKVMITAGRSRFPCIVAILLCARGSAYSISFYPHNNLQSRCKYTVPIIQMRTPSWGGFYTSKQWGRNSLPSICFQNMGSSFTTIQTLTGRFPFPDKAAPGGNAIKCKYFVISLSLLISISNSNSFYVKSMKQKIYAMPCARLWGSKMNKCGPLEVPDY